MMQNKDMLYVSHVIESISKIEDYLSGRDYAEFCSNSMLYDAVVRNLQILAESTQKISKQIKYSHSEIAWKDIAGFRNILVHDYLEGIDEGAIWNIIVNDLIDLKQKFETIQSEIQDTKDGSV